MQVTRMSLESFEKAAEEALLELPAGPEGLRSARVDEFRIEQGGFVGQTQFIVTVSGSDSYGDVGSD